jgi:tetratricopeptide (TPR) repeat protein
MGCCGSKSVYGEVDVVFFEAPDEVPSKTPAQNGVSRTTVNSSDAKTDGAAARTPARISAAKTTIAAAKTPVKAPFETPVKTRVLMKAPLDLKHVLRRVQPTTLELFGKLNVFNKNKRGFKAVVESVDPDGLLCGIEVEAVGLFAGNQIKVEFYQRQVDGTPVRSVEDLYRVAEAVHEKFDAFLQNIASTAGVNVKLAPLKGKLRAEEKGYQDYVDRECPDGGPVVGWVFDIVRGTLLCDSAEQIEAVVKLFVADTRVTVVITFKNRFKNPTPNGYCDMLFQIVFCDDGISHVCEVQVHLRQIKEYEAEHKSHEAYDYFRVFFDGSMNTVAARLEDMAKIVGKDFVPAEDDTPAADVMEDIVSDAVASKSIHRLHTTVVFCDSCLSEYDLAVYICKKALETTIAEPEYGNARQSDMVKGNMLLAGVLLKQDKLREAMGICEICMTIQLKTLGPEHSCVAATYSLMGNILRQQNKPEDAREMFNKTLAIQQKTLGPQHRDMAATYSDLGSTFEEVLTENNRNCFFPNDKLDEAMQMYEKCLAIQLKTLGPDHSNVASTYMRMGIIRRCYGKTYESQKMLRESLEMHRKCLTIQLKTFGPEHRSLANTYMAMGATLLEQGKLEQREALDTGKLGEAMEQYEKALTIELKLLGPEHSDVGKTYWFMGVAFHEYGALGAAMEKYEIALEIRLTNFGSDEKIVGDTKLKIAVVLLSQDNPKFERALELVTDVVRIYEGTIGKNHHETIDATKLLANTHTAMGMSLLKQGELGEAMEQYEKALSIMLKILGPEHSDVGGTYLLIGSALYRHGCLGAAIEKFEKALAIYLKTLGPDHRNVGQAKWHLAFVLVSQGNPAFERALELITDVVRIYEGTIGKDHHETIDAVRLLAGIHKAMGMSLLKQGEFREAQEKFEEALAIVLEMLGPKHSDVGGTYLLIGSALYQHGCLGAAIEKCEKALAFYLKTLGPDDMHVGQAKWHLATVLVSQDNPTFERALELVTDVVRICERVNGKDHEETIKAVKAVEVFSERLRAMAG